MHMDQNKGQVMDRLIFAIIFRSDEGLKLETSAFQIICGGNSAFINVFYKNKFSYITLPPTKHHFL